MNFYHMGSVVLFDVSVCQYAMRRRPEFFVWQTNFGRCLPLATRGQSSRRDYGTRTVPALQAFRADLDTRP